MNVGSEDAKKALQGQKQFFYWAVHDLRNPCNSMEQVTDQAIAKLNVLQNLCLKIESFANDGYIFHQ